MKRFLCIFFGLTLLELLIFYSPVRLVPHFDGSMESRSSIDTLEMRFDGHIYIKASIGDDTTKYWFMFDTGCTNSVIDEELAKEQKLSVFTNGRITKDANNTSQVVQLTKIPEINIGHASFRNMTFQRDERKRSVCFEKKDYGIIGSNIIRRANWLIDFPAKKVYMIKGGSVELNGLEEFILPYTSSYRNGVPKIEVAVNGIQIDEVIFDTGSDGWLDLPMKIYKAHQNIFEETKKFESYGEHNKSLFGTVDKEIALLIADSLKIGDLALHKQPVNFGTKTAKLLGNSFLSTYNIFLDNENKKITLLSRLPKRTVSIERSGFGFALKFDEDKKVRIARVDKDSPSDKAGITYNDELIAIGGVSYSGDECGLSSWLSATIGSDTVLSVEIRDKGILKLKHEIY